MSYCYGNSHVLDQEHYYYKLVIEQSFCNRNIKVRMCSHRIDITQLRC